MEFLYINISPTRDMYGWGSDKTRNEGNGNEEMEMGNRNEEKGKIKVRPGECL